MCDLDSALLLVCQISIARGLSVNLYLVWDFSSELGENHFAYEKNGLFLVGLRMHQMAFRAYCTRTYQYLLGFTMLANFKIATALREVGKNCEL